MRRAVLYGAVALAALTFAPAATAAPDALGCLRAGGDGTLSALTQGSKGNPTSELFSGSLTGVTTLGGTPFGRFMFGCSEADGNGDTTAVADAEYQPGGGQRVHAYVRSASAGQPVTFDTVTKSLPASLDVAVGPRGDVTVAWVEYTGPDAESVRVRMARRPAGGAFGLPETVADVERGDLFDVGADVAVGVDGGGATTVVWTQSVKPTGPDSSEASSVHAVTVPAGERPGSAQTLSPVSDEQYGLALAVAADGHAVAAWTGLDGTSLVERAAGAAQFGAKRSMPGTAASDLDNSPAEPTAAVGPDGEALVTWFGRHGLDGVWHANGADFGAPRRIWTYGPAQRRGVTAASVRPAQVENVSEPIIEFVPAGTPPQLPIENIHARSLIGPGGRIVVTWPDVIRNSDYLPDAMSVSGTIAGGFGAARRVSGDCRPVSGLTPFQSNGGPLLAWTDNAGWSDQDPTGAGRLHVGAYDYARPSEAPAISVKATAPRRTQAVYYDEPVELTASCDRACDLRAWVPGPSGLPRAVATVSLPGRGRARISLLGDEDTGLAPRRAGARTVRIRACDPNGVAVADTKVAVRMVRKRTPPLAHILKLRARRSGKHTIVTWHTDVPARRQYFVVQPDAIVRGTSRRFYRVRIGVTDRVTVAVVASDPPHRSRVAMVRVSRP